MDTNTYIANLILINKLLNNMTITRKEYYQMLHEINNKLKEKPIQ